MAEPNPEPTRQPDPAPSAADILGEPPDPVHIEAFEDRPEVAEAIDDDTTVPGLPSTAAIRDDPDTPQFLPPAG
jgi:hypothetical protein